MPAGLRAALAIEAFRHTAAYDARIVEELPPRMAAAGVELPPDPGLPGIARPVPADAHDRPREGRDPALRREPAPAGGPLPAPRGAARGRARSRPARRRSRARRSATTTSSTPRRRPRSAGALRGPACVIVKHTNPCGAAERATLLEAWQAALAGDPVSAFGGVVALTRPVDAAGRRGARRRSSSRSSSRPAYDEEALAILAGKPNLRVLVHPPLGGRRAAGPCRRPTGPFRTAGGAVLVTAPDTLPDDPATWRVVSARAPTDAERRDLDLAWRLCRGVTSNAIVLVRDGRLIGLGSGQT